MDAHDIAGIGQRYGVNYSYGGSGGGALHNQDGKESDDMHDMVPEATQLIVEGLLMKLLAQSPDGTLMCCANDTHLKFVDSRFLKLYETNTPGPILAACFHPQKYELFLKIDSRTLIFDLATKEYRTPEESDTMIPPEPWQPPPPPPGAVLSHSHIGGGMSLSGEKRRSGSGRPKGSKDKTQRKPRSAAAQEFEKEVVHQLTVFCGDDASKWNAKKPAIDAIKASPIWETHWIKSGLNEQQLVQFVHRLKAKRMGGKEVGGGGKPEGGIAALPGDIGGMPSLASVGGLQHQPFLQNVVPLMSMYPGSNPAGIMHQTQH
mmetsp:Transcript_34784/g.82470  ORF Transcript_34784/g.82470 Transcript_34784/m.82470 type:complete len:318 (-) Transcript_34784:567-1520(-)|eukprot:CAMPEP_0180151382 /NCGR_PEP_ID=MMETSP0986-20121125/22095_1 /TAXON_ID=697907 /ORGANISM="non described non described, Strain CCMP2293" /LENGTH=317 /DNA_ID=CAMNT_0022098665 /DNA_START=97 /DNA_END=1050 /DNA_ORIENTATION=+